MRKWLNRYQIIVIIEDITYFQDAEDKGNDRVQFASHPIRERVAQQSICLNAVFCIEVHNHCFAVAPQRRYHYG